MEAAEDDLAVRNLIAHFAIATDVGSIHEYMECLTDDPVMVIDSGPVTRSGIDEIRSSMEQSRAAGLFGPESGTAHVLGAIHVALDGDEARAHTPFQFLQTTSGRAELVSVGRYTDTCIRTRSGWRLSRREITLG